MTRAIIRRPRAEDDLIDIWSYIADDNESAADGILAKIETTLKRLADHPLTGRPRFELQADIRSVPIGRYVIFYRPILDGIELVRVLSSYLDVDLNDVR